MNVRPTARGLVAAGLGVLLLVLGLVWHYPGVVAFGAGLSGLAVLAVVSVLLPAPITAHRSVAPLRVPRQGECTATLRVASTGRLSPRLDAVERIGDERRPIAVPRLRAGRTIEASYPIPTVRRGAVTVGPLRLRRVGVAGLAVAQRTVSAPVTVHVLPRVLPTRGLPAGVRRGHVGADERVERGGTDLIGLREYVPGDDLRRVHWATTARSGTLMVREDADPARPYLTVLLDDRAASYPTPTELSARRVGGPPRHTDNSGGDAFEEAVEVAASLISSALEDGHPVRLASVAGQVELDIPAAPPGMLAPGADEPLRALAELRPAGFTDGAAPTPVRDLDVVVVITGAAAALDPFVAEASRAPLGVVCVVDERRAAVEATGSVLVLRAPRAEDLLRSWDTTT